MFDLETIRSQITALHFFCYLREQLQEKKETDVWGIILLSGLHGRDGREWLRANERYIMVKKL